MHALKEIDTFILAGGLGTRLKAAIGNEQKVTTPIHGEPFIHRLLRQVEEHGCSRVVLGLGYRAEAVRALLGDSFNSLSLEYSFEDEPAGTGGALVLALPHLKSKHILVMNGDSYIAANLSAFVTEAIAREAPASLLLTHVEECSSFGQVEQARDGAITDFREKGEHSGPGWINAGIYLFTRKALAGLPARRPLSLERDIFPAWIGSGLHGVQAAGRFLDIGTPERLRQASHFFDAPATTPEAST